MTECQQKTQNQTHYSKQKQTQFIYFKINEEDGKKMEKGLFTIYDFISNLSSFSQTKKDLTISVLESLKESPKTFVQLLQTTQAEKSTLYLLLLALQRSGLVEKSARRKPISLSSSFSITARKYSEWWKNWASIRS